MSKPRIMIITGYGLNCEVETELAWRRAGGQPVRMHLNDLIAQPAALHECDALMFIGGFSFGDHMGSGLALARRVQHHLREDIDRFIDSQKLIMGICNGFQALINMGLLPAFGHERWEPSRTGLVRNSCGHFIDRWVRIRFEENSACVFTKGLEPMDLPIRHGEGRFWVQGFRRRKQMSTYGCVACRYVDPATNELCYLSESNPNGSVQCIAGVCSPDGRIFGMMPHPEAYIHPQNHPQWDLRPEKARGEGAGLEIFRNAIRYMQ